MFNPPPHTFILLKTIFSLKLLFAPLSVSKFHSLFAHLLMAGIKT